MKTIIVTTQEELDALPKSFKEFTIIEIRSDPSKKIIVREAYDSSQVEAYDSSQVEASGSSRVVALGSSQVEAYDSSRVVAWGSSQVEAYDSSQVEALGSSQVEAHNSSQVEARGSSRVVAWGSSRVVAYGSSRVVARDSSRVVAWDNVATYLKSDLATVSLLEFSCCFKLAKGTINKKSKTCTVITPEYEKGVNAWLERHGIKPKKQVIVFKRVSKDWQTQEGTNNETIWKPGEILEHHDWNPKNQERGEGKYHACPTPYFCDEFRNKSDDRYIAIQVEKKDLFCWDDEPQYPHKIAFRKGLVLHEVNRFGEKV